MIILAYERDATGGKLGKMAQEVYGPTARVVSISDFSGVGDYWVGEFLYSSSTASIGAVPGEEEILSRCRVLRSWPQEKSIERIRRVYHGFANLLHDLDVRAVFSPMPDCYTLDIMARVAKDQQIPFISFVGSFINGYFRPSVYGEAIEVRSNVPQSEVMSVYKSLTDDSYRPNFSLMKKRSNFEVLWRYWRRRAIERVYYPLRMHAAHDLDNYHYNTLLVEGKKCRYIGRDRLSFYKSLDQVKMSGSDVYMPLHMTPEATTDYWIRDFAVLPYERAVVDVLERSDPNIHFILKEHPSMYGWRPIEFYESIARLDNVDIVHPYESSNDLLKRVDNVLVHTGSVGVESLLRGKRVLALTDNYYSDLHPNVSRIEVLRDRSVLDAELESPDALLFIESLLKAQVRGTYRGNWSEVDNRTITAMAEAARCVLGLEE